MEAGLTSSPIIVVGQPRSGSTILTRVLNEVPGLFVVNDFYVLQRIDAVGLWGPLTAAQAQEIAKWIYRIIEVRATQEIGKTLSHPIHLTLDQLADLKQLVMKEWPDGVLWHQILNEIMSCAAALAGCNRWGYNTPQDFLHLGRLFEAYPNCRVVLQLRQPEDVLSSYKNVIGVFGRQHERRRYNPFTIAIAWRAAAHAYETWVQIHPNKILFLRYEDLVHNTDGTIQRVSQFLDTPFPSVALSAYGRNSSYVAGGRVEVVTDTEVWICERIIGTVLERLGFVRCDGSGLSWSGFWATLKAVRLSTGLFFEQYLLNSNYRARLVRLFSR